MIRKYLICGKNQIYLQSRNTDAYAEIGRVVELLLPIRNFWDIESRLKDMEYLISSKESQTDINTAFQKLFKESARFAVREEDRLWLYEQSK